MGAKLVGIYSSEKKDIYTKLEHYEKQSCKANKDYVRTGKLADRLRATAYQAKVELLQELLG